MRPGSRRGRIVAQSAGVAHGDRAVVGVGVPDHLLRVAVVDHRVCGDEAADGRVVLPAPSWVVLVGSTVPPTKLFSLGQLGTLPGRLPKGVCQRSIAVWSLAEIAIREVLSWSAISQLTPAAMRIATSRPAWL